MGVVTGIPMELQFGTNCAMFANGSYGLLIGLAMRRRWGLVASLGGAVLSDHAPVDLVVE